MTAINKRSPDSRALVLALMVAFAYCLGVSACQDHSSSDPDVVAFVNGTPITVAQFTAALHRLDQNARAGRLPRLDEKMKLVVLRDLIDRRIVLLRANQLGLSVSDQELNLAIAEVQKDYSAESFRDMIIKQYIDIVRYGQKSGAPWVARLTEEGREFMEGIRDYSSANNTGSRGIFVYYAVAPGLYEVNEPLAFGKARRYCISVADAMISEVTCPTNGI